MAIILDADVIIRGEKETFDLIRWVTAQPTEQFEMAAITVAERGTVWNAQPGRKK